MPKEAKNGSRSRVLRFGEVVEDNEVMLGVGFRSLSESGGDVLSWSNWPMNGVGDGDGVQTLFGWEDLPMVHGSTRRHSIDIWDVVFSIDSRKWMIDKT
nr:calcium-binding EF-hand [Tanacetum cinerariifolium]